MCLFLGALHCEGSGQREGAGPQTEDPDVVGGLLFICGQDSPDHPGGELQPRRSSITSVKRVSVMEQKSVYVLQEDRHIHLLTKGHVIKRLQDQLLEPSAPYIREGVWA